MHQAVRRVAVVLNGKAGALLGQGDPVQAMREAFLQAGLGAIFRRAGGGHAAGAHRTRRRLGRGRDRGSRR